ncbi:MAG: hypothetical protein R6V50_02300 [Thermoplasmatota archaeon]
MRSVRSDELARIYNWRGLGDHPVMDLFDCPRSALAGCGISENQEMVRQEKGA